MSARLEDLDPDVRAKAEALVELAREAGCPIRVTHTLRTWDEQAHLYAKGRTLPGTKVTNAPPGYSWHNFKRAFDVCFVGPTPYEGPWEKLGPLGESVGLEWGGRWKKFTDRPHFQDTGGISLAQARASYAGNLA